MLNQQNCLNSDSKTGVSRDAIRGCIFGGAVGDALGYPVEFLSEMSIFQNNGEKGIASYAKNGFTGKAMISDDTQMTLFTANGLLVGATAHALQGEQNLPRT